MEGYSIQIQSVNNQNQNSHHGKTSSMDPSGAEPHVPASFAIYIPDMDNWQADLKSLDPEICSLQPVAF